MQSHTDAKEENRPEIAPETPSGKVLDTYAACLFLAESAKKAVKLVLPLGADNNYPRGAVSKAQRAAYDAIEKAEREFLQYESKPLSPKDADFRERFILDQKCQADIHSKHQAGNCAAQVAVAFTYLWQCNVRPISYAMVGDMVCKNGHAFLIIGDINKPHVAVVCDPWNDECYPLFQFNNHKAARQFGKKIFVSYTGDTEDHSDEIKKVFGHQIRLPDSIDKAIDDHFTEKFLATCKKVMPHWADSPIHNKENIPPEVVQPDTPSFASLPTGYTETGYLRKK
ncbi:MAG TPA: hypothetical protein VLJ15_06600 [Gammaproteobacteria bacterium]|nr:hypothetical protein [Gammaproteobacteria bacterium]